MSFIWITIAGVMATIVAKLLMSEDRVGGLFILGFGGSIIAAVMQYSLNQPIGFIAPMIGAVVLLSIYAATPRRPTAQIVDHEVDHEDLRKAA